MVVAVLFAGVNKSSAKTISLNKQVASNSCYGSFRPYIVRCPFIIDTILPGKSSNEVIVIDNKGKVRIGILDKNTMTLKKRGPSFSGKMTGYGFDSKNGILYGWSQNEYHCIDSKTGRYVKRKITALSSLDRIKQVVPFSGTKGIFCINVYFYATRITNMKTQLIVYDFNSDTWRVAVDSCRRMILTPIGREGILASENCWPDNNRWYVVKNDKIPLQSFPLSDSLTVNNIDNIVLSTGLNDRRIVVCRLDSDKKTYFMVTFDTTLKNTQIEPVAGQMFAIYLSRSNGTMGISRSGEWVVWNRANSPCIQDKEGRMVKIAGATRKEYQIQFIGIGADNIKQTTHVYGGYLTGQMINGCFSTTPEGVVVYLDNSVGDGTLYIYKLIN